LAIGRLWTEWAGDETAMGRMFGDRPVIGLGFRVFRVLGFSVRVMGHGPGWAKYR
jgi:hypothetical protein